MTSVNKLRRTLSALAEDERAAEVFGASSHGFQLNALASRSELQAVESHLGCELPAEYRTFLLDAGNGGADPGYGLWPVGRWDPTNRLLEAIEPPGWPDAPGEHFPHSGPWTVDKASLGPPPGSNADDTAHDRYYAALDEFTWATGNGDGALPIADLGCAIRLLLIVAGAERGHIWIDDRANDGGIYPASILGRDRLTFTEAYDDWLNQSIVFCQTGKRAHRPW